MGNKKYIGKYHYNDIEIEGGCPAIVGKDIYYKYSERAQKNKRAPAHSKAKVEYVLSGKLFCGHCGHPMAGDSGTGRHGVRYHYYSCSGRKNKQTKCNKRRENKDFIEWYVVEQTVNYVLTPKRIECIAERVVAEYDKEFSSSNIKKFEKNCPGSKQNLII